jgi:hypothetical protein
MRLLDSIQDKSLHKLILIEDGGEFAVLGQASHRRSMPIYGHMSRDAAKAYWRKVCLSHFYRVTHNLHDAEVMANRRIAAIH